MVFFFRAVLKWLAALCVACGLFLFLIFLLIASVSVAFQPKPLQVERGSILVIDLALNLVDSPRAVDPLAKVLREMQGDDRSEVPLRHAMEAVRRAQHDDRITGILLQGNLAGAGLGNSIPALREFRASLLAFQESGKKVWAYVDNDGLGDYYLKSVAGDLWMNPYSMLEFKGLATEVLYWGDTFERFGVGVQVVRAGEYKSAAESFIGTAMSPENREQTTALLGSIWGGLLADLGAARGLEASALDRLASDHALLMSEEVLQLGLVDALVPYDSLIENLIEEGAFDPANESFHQVAFSAYLGTDRRRVEPTLGTGNEVAVVYVEGAIVDGEGRGAFAGADSITRLLRQVRQDAGVKAVVLRVNSPGGSATASEKILREVELTAQAKPVVVSMGGYAASGGYWVASQAHAIVAEPATVTGSIGVFMMLPHIAGLIENLDLRVESVQTNRLTTVTSIFREKNPEELARFQGFANHTYDQFIDRVSRGRQISDARAREIADGRVWSGAQALEIGLVDRLGGLSEAIAHAGDLAGIDDDFRVTDHPQARSFEEVLAEMFSGGASASWSEAAVRMFARDRRFEALKAELQWIEALNDPRDLYAYSPLRLQW